MTQRKEELVYLPTSQDKQLWLSHLTLLAERFGSTGIVGSMANSGTAIQETKGDLFNASFFSTGSFIRKTQDYLFSRRKTK